jgi:RNA polymerase sigma factor (sigma-70 family)
MSETPYSDNQLIEMIKNGGEDRQSALKSIFLSCYPVAQGKIMKQGGKLYEADDAITEAVIIFDNHIRNGKFKPKGALKSYFVAICYWQWLAMKRPTKRISFANETYTFDGEDFETPELIMLASDQKQWVSNLLNEKELGEKCREALRLYGLNYSMQEIAEKFSTTELYARQIIFRCRGKLREILEKKPTLMKQLLDTL